MLRNGKNNSSALSGDAIDDVESDEQRMLQNVKNNSALSGDTIDYTEPNEKNMLRNGKNNNSALRGDANDDLESNEKKTKKLSLKTICCILLLMAITITAVFVVFFCYAPKVLDQDNRCFNGDKPFHNYNLFSTKTLYTTAFHYLNRSPSSLSTHSNHKQNQNNQYVDESSVRVPKIFSSHQTLKQVHDQLSREGCSVRQFHYFGRHAARTPDEDDIQKINKRIKDIIERIDSSRHDTVAALHLQSESSTPQPVAPDVAQTPNVNTSEVICQDPVAKLLRWKNFTDPEEGNMVTEFGFRESEAIAIRLRDIFPELFNGSHTTINFGTTEELRTAQTAISFLKHMVNPPDVGCEVDSFPTPINLDPQHARKIKSDQCFRDFLAKHSNSNLKFHKLCKSYDRKIPVNFDYGVKNTSKIEFIADSLSHEMKLTHQKLSVEDARAIYDVCRYETAQFGQQSDWCHFFKEKDLKFLEYLTDVIDFTTDAYGTPELSRSACFVTKELTKAFKSYRSNRDSRPEANFYFTHSAVIQRLIATSIDLRDDKAYKDDVIRKALDSGEVPPERLWRSSLLSPFSANIAFTLYDCSNPSLPSTVDLKPIKVVASLNEQPIILRGCEDSVCEYSQFIERSRLSKLSDPDECSIDNICRINPVIQ